MENSLTKQTIRNFYYALLIAGGIAFILLIIYILATIVLYTSNGEFNIALNNLGGISLTVILFAVPVPFIVSFALLQRFNIKRDGDETKEDS